MDNNTLGIKDARLHRLFQYWDSKRKGRRFPARSDIDPLDIPYILGRIALVEVTHDPLRFRYRLYGSELAVQNGYDLTGLYHDEIPVPEFREFIAKAWRTVVERGEPVHAFYDRIVDERVRHYETLRLPLSTDGVTVDMLLIAVVYGS